MAFHFKKIWLFRYNYIVVAIISLAIVCLLGQFLYKNFYKSIAQTDAIALLKDEVSLEAINRDLFQQIIQVNQEKKAGTPKLLTPPQSKWLNFKNPFEPF
ncbi:MAG: hypothetical protein V1692_00305 [bacterium]